MTRRPPWHRRDWAVCAALFVAPFVAYWRLWAPAPWRRWFPDGDFTDQFFAFARFEVEQLARGALPAWNPFAYAGTPFWADVQAAVAYPPSLANALAHAATVGRMTFIGLELEAIAHLGLAGVMMFAFARDVLGTRAAAFGALTLAFGGFLNGYPPLQLAVLEAAVWLPLILLGIRRTCALADAGETPWRGVALVAGGLAAAVLAGHPQTALYVSYTTAAYAVWHGRLWQRTALKRAAWLVPGAALGVAASAAGWLPAASYLRASNRADLPYEALAHGFPIAELGGLVITGLTHWAPLYVGLVPLLLALGAVAAAFTGSTAPPTAHLATERAPYAGTHPVAAAVPGDVRRETQFWAAAAVVWLALSIGANGPAFDIAYVFAPGWDLFRGQERAAYVVSFALAMLAATGVRLWLDGDDRVRGFVLRVAPALAAVLLATVALGPAQLGSGALRGLAVLAGLVAVAMYAAPDRRATPPGPLPASSQSNGAPWPIWLAAAAALTLFDLVPATFSMNLVSHRPDELDVSPVIATLRATASDRVANHDRLPPNFGVLHGLEAITGASPLWPRTWQALNEALAANETRLWQLLAVSHVVTWRGALDLPASELLALDTPDGAVRVFALETSPQWAWRVSEARVVRDAEAAAVMAGDEFDPYGTVLLSEGQGGVFPGSTATLAVQDRGVGRVEITTTGDAPAWIVFSEMYDSGWTATVDGAAVTPLRADLALIAVPIPAGEHTVSLRYAPRSVGWGLSISLVAWLGIAVVAAASLRTHRAGGGHRSVAAIEA